MSACSWGLIHSAKVVETCIQPLEGIQLGHYELEYGLLTDATDCNIGIDMPWNTVEHPFTLYISLCQCLGGAECQH